jgi:hypothetical protein
VPASPVFKIVATNSHAHERLGNTGFPKDGKIFLLYRRAKEDKSVTRFHMHRRKRNARNAKISHKFELSEPKRFENRKLYIHATNPQTTIVGIDLFKLFS